jgi:uncharacterized protein (TIGR02646 family)
MRAIQKGAEPRELLDWKRANATSPQNLIYSGGGFPSEAVRKALLSEQFHLCAYTLKSLRTSAECEAQNLDTRHSCHVEHLLPQCRNVPAETIDYQNMLACYPPSDSTEACQYGAQAKADYDPAANPFVSPLSPNVEQHFQFGKNGSVTGVTDAAVATVTVLKLDHPMLVNDRKAVINGWLNPKNGRSLSASAARRLAVEMSRPDQQNRLRPFCVAVAQTAIEHAERAERRSSRLNQRSAS